MAKAFSERQRAIISTMKRVSKFRIADIAGLKQLIVSIGIGGLICSILTLRLSSKLDALHNGIYSIAKTSTMPDIPVLIPVIFSLSVLLLLAGLLSYLPAQNHAPQKCLVWFCAYAVLLGTIAMTVARGHLFYGYWAATLFFCITSAYLSIDIIKGLREWAMDKEGNSYDIGKLSLIWAVIATLLGILL